MKFVVNGAQLGDAVSKVVKAVGSKTTNPVLEGIKLSVVGDELTLTATDTEISIEKTIISSTFTEGETLVPGKMFSEFIKKILGMEEWNDPRYQSLLTSSIWRSNYDDIKLTMTISYNKL